MISFAQDVYATIAKSKSCSRHGKRHRHGCKKSLFPATGSLEFVATEVLEPLLKTTQDNQDIESVTNWYPELGFASSNFEKSSVHIWNLLFDRRIFRFGISAYSLMDSKRQFVTMFFSSISSHFTLIRLTSTTYHAQTCAKSWVVHPNHLHMTPRLFHPTTEKLRIDSAVVALSVWQKDTPSHKHVLTKPYYKTSSTMDFATKCYCQRTAGERRWDLSANYVQFLRARYTSATRHAALTRAKVSSKVWIIFWELRVRYANSPSR